MYIKIISECVLMAIARKPNSKPKPAIDEAAADAFCYAEGPAALLVGPEGGFDDAERAAIRTHPASVAVSLGPRILRGETAAIAGISVWMAEAGDWFGEE